MRTAHTLLAQALAQALAAYDAADASWKPAEWFESVRACLALPPVIAHPGAAAKSFDEKFLNLDDRRVRGYYIEGWCDCAARHIPSPAWCASVDAELAATAEADAQPVKHVEVQMRVGRRGAWRKVEGGLQRAEYLLKEYPSVYEMRKLYAVPMVRPDCYAPAPTLPTAAVAEGAQLDGESLEPSE